MPTPPRGPSLAWPLLSPWEPPWHLSVYLVLISLVFVWVVYQPFPKCFVYLLSPVAHILALSIFSINMNCLVYLFFLKRERERDLLQVFQGEGVLGGFLVSWSLPRIVSKIESKANLLRHKRKEWEKKKRGDGGTLLFHLARIVKKW